MWKCLNCREQVDEDFDVCWSCGTSKDGVEDPEFRKADDVAEMDIVPALPIRVATEAPVSERVKASPEPLRCLRCTRALRHLGTKSFHEGFSWGAFGDLAEFFVNKENFDVYVCPRCGRVEFFVSGIGEELRAREVSE